jgi:hypothetical protein
MSERIQLSAASVVQASASLIARAKSQVAAMYWIDAMFLLGIISFAKSSNYDTTEKVGGSAFWILVLALITRAYKRKVTRRQAIEHAAKTDPTISWVLNGRQLVGVDQHNTPQVKLSAKITNALHATLTAVPEARVVER